MTESNKIDRTNPEYTYTEDYVHEDGRVQRITVRRFAAVKAQRVQWCSPRNRGLLSRTAESGTYVPPPSEAERRNNDADYSSKIYTGAPIDGRREWTEDELSAEERAMTVRTRREMDDV